MRTVSLTVLAGVAGVLAATHFYQHDPATSAGYLPCIFHQLTQLHCPGCGGQRALHHILHGRVALALQHNALLFLLGALLATEAGFRLRRIRPFPLNRVWVGRFVVVAVLGFALLRNLPCWPCSLLAPPV